MQSDDFARIQQAQAALASFAGIQSPPLDAPAAREAVKAALLTLAEAADYQMFGILADGFDQGMATLQAYAQAFGYELPTYEQEPVAGSVYIKFNPNLGSYYISSYTQEHRGVLVSYQSAINETINQTYGHFPLDLF
ncbi:MAG: DUF1824 family protein [Acaryochloridaceae cyanobacterium CSU_3_4]|nr:DUF1824 family protein [Acaryochloridaceae cyanobacterium CSU_3_4]